MLKKLLVRFYHGFSITMIVDIIVHYIVAQIKGSTVTPAFAARFSCEASAILTQLALVGVIGMAFAGAAIVFEIERWSFLKQGIVHFLITAAVWIPIVCVCWTPINGKGLVFTILGWTLTYIITWTVPYFIWRKNVSEVNQKIRAYCARKEQE